MPPTPYETAKSGWPSAWLTWILTVQQKIKMIALIFFKVVRKSTLVFVSLFLALEVKSPKHHLDTSRKRPKPDPKNPVAKSGLRTPLPKASNNKTQAVALDAKSPINTIWTRAENGQNPNQKTLSRYLWNPQKHLLGLAKSGLGNIASESLEQQNTSPKASNSKTRCKTVAKSSPRTPLPKASNSKTRSGLGALDAKSPKHHLGHKPKTVKTVAKKLFHVTFGIHNNNLLGLAKSRLEA